MTEEKQRKFSPLITGVLAVFCCVLWGSAYSAIKIGYRLFAIASEDTGTVILFAGIRFALAGLMVLLVGCLLQKRLLIPRVEEIKKIWNLSMLQTSIQYAFFYIGLAHATGVKGAIITGSNSVLAILVASLLFRQEKLTLPKTVGCFLGFSGVMLANLSGNGMGTGATLKGEGFVFLSALSYAFAVVFMKRYSKESDPVLLSGWQFFVGGLTLSFLGICMGGHLTVFTAPAMGVLFYLVFISAAAYTIWGILLKYNPVSQVTIYGFSNPVVGVLLSALFLGEGEQAFSAQNLGALCLVSAGIYTVNRFSETK